MAKSQNHQCLNCGTALRAADRFCPNCGQEDRDLRISFWEFIKDFLTSNFNFDTKLGRTLSDLLLRPGRITQEYVAGKRASYVKPLQLYFFVSFVYFLLLNYSTDPSGSIQIGSDLEEIQTDAEPEDPTPRTEEPAVALDSIPLTLNEAEEPWKREMLEKLERLSDPDSEQLFTRTLFKNLSVSMFFLMPLFAFLVWLFVRKRSPYYLNALVFSIHYHVLVFILFSTDMLVGFVYDRAFTTVICMLLSLMFLMLSLKRVYDLEWLRAMWQTFVVASLYTLFLGLALLVTVILSVAVL